MSEAVFTCAMCGHCCEGEGGIVLSRRDAQRLAAHCGMDVPAFLGAYAVQYGQKRHLTSNGEGACVFFRPGAGCTVHPARPDVCRAWPFFRGNLMDASSFEMAKADCPGISQGVPHHVFARSGVAYLREHGLASEEPDAGNALHLDFPGVDQAE